MGEESLRASDADREEAVSALRAHLLAGRLTPEEFTGRVESALRARTGGDLARIQSDLPEVSTGPARPPGRAARFTPALLSHVVRRGRLRLRGWTVAASVLGDLDLDLREATIDGPDITVTVIPVLGNADIYVPDEVNADVAGFALFGHVRERGRDVVRPGAPSVHVRVLGAGTVDVWRVPRELRTASYSEIFRAAQDRRQLPGAGPGPRP
jgi:uncharacterized protein DUF1707/cell wall-active antibiotic response 4TMS protein YvqF